MIKLILSFLLHQANRSDDRREQFYPIKDKILKAHGKEIGYDIQHIAGKKCRSCGGCGYHSYYSNHYPYKEYDRSACWHCHHGWFKLPQWICLSRIQLGQYTFHRPLKKELAVKNPWVENKMGWKVSDTPVIEGYIEHSESWFGGFALLILFRAYDRHAFTQYLPEFKDEMLRRFRRFKRKYHWSNFIIERLNVVAWRRFDEYGNEVSNFDDNDFPF